MGRVQETDVSAERRHLFPHKQKLINDRQRLPSWKMKLKAMIRGSRVHEVGYRVFLLQKAIELGGGRFSATTGSRMDHNC